jgi:hypothetical protein
LTIAQGVPLGERVIAVTGCMNPACNVIDDSTLPFGEIFEAALELQFGKLGYPDIHWTTDALCFPFAQEHRKKDPGECFPAGVLDRR